MTVPGAVDAASIGAVDAATALLSLAALLSLLELLPPHAARPNERSRAASGKMAGKRFMKLRASLKESGG